MAGHLQSGGHTLHVVRHRSAIPQKILDGGAVEHDSLTAAARQADIIMTMVPGTPDVERVLFDERGIASGLSAGKIVVDMSSISPADTKVFATRINGLGCGYLDAPVSGGEVGAKAATLTIMVGGSPEVFETVRPLFELMGETITLVGANGAGQTAKVANQIVVALTIEAVAEALLFRVESRCGPSAGARGAHGRVCRVEDHGDPRRADDHAGVRTRWSHRASSEGSEPGAERRPSIGTQSAQYGRYPGALQRRASQAVGRDWTTRRWSRRWRSSPTHGRT